MEDEKELELFALSGGFYVWDGFGYILAGVSHLDAPAGNKMADIPIRGTQLPYVVRRHPHHIQRPTHRS